MSTTARIARRPGPSPRQIAAAERVENAGATMTRTAPAATISQRVLRPAGGMRTAPYLSRYEVWYLDQRDDIGVVLEFLPGLFIGLGVDGATPTSDSMRDCGEWVDAQWRRAVRLDELEDPYNQEPRDDSPEAQEARDEYEWFIRDEAAAGGIG